MKKEIFMLGLEVFNTGIQFVDEQGNVSYGAYGRFVLDDIENEIGFQANEQKHSYGWQVDGSYIKNGKRINVYYVLGRNEEISKDEYLIHMGNWQDCLKEASLSPYPCYVILALDDIRYDLGLTNLQAEIKFTNKAWNEKNLK